MADTKKDTSRLHHCVPDWVNGFTAWLPKRQSPVRRVGYTLKDLARRRLLKEDAVSEFCTETLLDDFAWRLVWKDESDSPDVASVVRAVCDAKGIVIFVHGWDGSGEIWEDLPALVLEQNPELIALIPDVNGFGGTPFSVNQPPIEKCSPPAIMQSLQMWFDLLSLRTMPGRKTTIPVTFVGHSMGGATLFYLDERRWKPGEVGRIAAAPALLMNDRQRQGFYKTLGASIQLTGLTELIDRLTENIIAPKLIEALAGWSSDLVQAEHRRIFRNTPEGVIARTFAAMGLLDADIPQRNWPFFNVFLANRDKLVGLEPTLDLLEELNFSPNQIRIALGDHYFFSVGKQADLHRRNRDLLMKDILKMHNKLSGG